MCGFVEAVKDGCHVVIRKESGEKFWRVVLRNASLVGLNIVRAGRDIQGVRQSCRVS